jgi:hypothetical protein
VRPDPLMLLGSGVTKERIEKRVFTPELVNQCEYTHSLEILRVKAMLLFNVPGIGEDFTVGGLELVGA